MLRVFLVARGAVERARLAERLRAAPVRIVGQDAAFTHVLATPVDVVVVSGDASPEDLRVIEGDMPAVLLVSDSRGAAVRASSCGARAWGVVPADAGTADLAAAIAALGRGLVVMPPEHARRRRPRDDDEATEGGYADPLTARERDVLELLAQGMGNREIARALGISAHTVKFHLAAVFGKLGASTRTEAVRRAVRRGIIAI